MIADDKGHLEIESASGSKHASHFPNTLKWVAEVLEGLL
jgi:hypothetical protein